MSPGRTILLFESSNAVLWAEDVALEEEIPVETVHAPAGSDSGCGIALSVATEDLVRLTEAIVEEGLPYEVWSGQDD